MSTLIIIVNHGESIKDESESAVVATYVTIK